MGVNSLAVRIPKPVGLTRPSCGAETLWNSTLRLPARSRFARPNTYFRSTNSSPRNHSSETVIRKRIGGIPSESNSGSTRLRPRMLATLFWIDFVPQVGHEQAGAPAPAIVLSPRTYNERAGLAVLCPITSQIKNYPFEVQLPSGVENPRCDSRRPAEKVSTGGHRRAEEKFGKIPPGCPWIQVRQADRGSDRTLAVTNPMTPLSPP